MKCKELKTGASLCFNRRIDFEELKALRDGGVECVEISFNYKDYYETLNFTEKYAEYAKNAADAGIELWSIHLPFSGLHDLSQLDDERREFTMKTHRELIDAAAKAGVKVAVVHPSAEPIPDDQREQRMINSKANLKALAEYAKSKGMRLAVENLPRTCLIKNSDEALEILRDNPDLWIVFDTNHLLGQDNVEFIKAVGDRIITLHVSDYDFIDERHWLPFEFEGKNDWKAIRDALEEVGYEGPWMYEVPSRNGEIKPSEFREIHMKIASL